MRHLRIFDRMAPHGAASGFINDDESGLRRDCEEWLEKLASFNASGDALVMIIGE